MDRRRRRRGHEGIRGAGTRLTTTLRVTPVDGGEVEYSDHVILEVSDRLNYEVGEGANQALTRRDCSCSCHSSFRGRRGATVYCGSIVAEKSTESSSST